MARSRTRLRGRGRMRKLLRRLPSAIRGELVVELRVTGRQIRQAVQAKTPRRTGALREGISERVLPTSLRLQVGLLCTPKGRSKLFYGRIQDLGRKAQVVLVQRRRRVKASFGGPDHTILRVSRGRKIASDIVATYPMKVRAMPAKHFVTGRYAELRRTLNDNLRGIWSRAMGTLAGGGDE